MLNKIIIMGRLTRDPEIRTTANGTKCASFSLAVERDYKTADGGRETDFIDCVAWRNTADFVERYFSKGRAAIVSGRLAIRAYTDKDGNKRRTAEVVAESIYFADSKKSDTANPVPPQAEAPAHNAFEMPQGDGSGALDAYYALLDDNGELPF